jgi:hypothetical protein
VWKFAASNVFPNFCVQANASAFQGQTLILAHPRQPLATECWQWCAVDKNAPTVVKQVQASKMIKAQAGAGMIATDDTENFERSADNLRGHVTTEQPYHYAMAVGHDHDPKWREALTAEGVDLALLPGVAGPNAWEASLRQFYRYWSTLMAAED